MSSWNFTNVIVIFFGDFHFKHYSFLETSSIQYNDWFLFLLFSWHFLWCLRGDQTVFKVGQQHFIGFDFCHQSYFLSILFIGIYSNQILVHDPRRSQWNKIILSKCLHRCHRHQHQHHYHHQQHNHHQQHHQKNIF